MMRITLAVPALLLLAACQQDPGMPNCGDANAAGCASPTAEESDAATEEEPSATETPGPDKSALNERKEPGKLLGYFAEAVNSGDWPAAALAWHSAEDGSPMT